MIRSYKSEWVKLRRRTFLLGSVAATAVAGLLGTLVPFIRADDAHDTMRPGAVDLDLEAADGAVAGVASMSPLLGAIALVIAAMVVVSEYTHGTLKNLLIFQPRRIRLLSGKLTAAAVFLAGLAVVTIVVSVVFAMFAGWIDGVDMSAWFTAAGIGEIFEALGSLLVANMVFGAIGVALAVLLRSAATSIGIGLAWALPGEQLLSSLWSDFGDFLPGSLAAAVTGEGSVGTTAAIVGSLVWIVGLTAVSMVVFQRREVAG